ncbi:hypothetical protein [Chryseolinea soli]|uniref:hypothetical protein n=1 Tax=Chryseolinea soli TaxID=2321403 RepID=UPI0016277ED6|nr:hypothetical protein [Chryseolinea soli]
MRTELAYVELKSGYSDNGPAWIGRGMYNRTGLTFYFNGRVFKKGPAGTEGNYFDVQTGEEYWISGVKKKGGDRHWAGSGTIAIDSSVVEAYLELRGLISLPKGYRVVTLDNVPAKETSVEYENQSRGEFFDESLRFKDVATLTDAQLDELIDYYRDEDLPSLYKKRRKEYIDTLNVLLQVKASRETKNPA